MRNWLNFRKRNYLNNYMIRLTNTTLCMAASGPTEKGFWKRGSTIQLVSCMRVKSQMWYETDKSELVLGQLLCLEAAGGSSTILPTINKCHEMNGDQEWRHRKSVILLLLLFEFERFRKIKLLKLLF